MKTIARTTSPDTSRGICDASRTVRTKTVYTTDPMSAIARITTAPGEMRRPVPRWPPDAPGVPRGSG